MGWRKFYRPRLLVNWEGFRRDHHRTRPAHGGQTEVRGRAHQLQSLGLSSVVLSDRKKPLYWEQEGETLGEVPQLAT